MPNSWSKEAYLKGLNYEYITFKKLFLCLSVWKWPRLYFPEEFRRNSVYSVTFLSYPVEIRFPMPPENRKGKKSNDKVMCLYQC